jgi:transcriptional regulator with XRE-family HTH domain
MDTRSLAINIRKIREAKHLKQEYVAEQIEVSPATYSKIENGKTSLSATRLQQIARVLQVSSALLLGDEIKPNSAEKQMIECSTALLIKEQQLIERDQKIAELERERLQTLEREQRLLNYIKLLEQQTERA